MADKAKAAQSKGAPPLLPLYQCHKRVHAAKIAAVEFGPDGAAKMALVDGGVFEVEAGYRDRFKGDEGDLGYLVVYADGYQSWSPSKAFDEGYTLASVLDQAAEAAEARVAQVEARATGAEARAAEAERRLQSVARDLQAAPADAMMAAKAPAAADGLVPYRVLQQTFQGGVLKEPGAIVWARDGLDGKVLKSISVKEAGGAPPVPRPAAGTSFGGLRDSDIPVGAPKPT
jgi:hypothetical protein